eukprot:936719_1
MGLNLKPPLSFNGRFRSMHGVSNSLVRLAFKSVTWHKCFVALYGYSISVSTCLYWLMIRLDLSLFYVDNSHSYDNSQCHDLETRCELKKISVGALFQMQNEFFPRLEFGR